MELIEVVVTGLSAPVSVSASTLRAERISQRQLTLFPSRSVAEGLHFVNGLTDKSECSVCGTSQIQINGMPGAYTLVLIDGMPVMGALASVYAMSSIPAALVDRVEVIRGPASTAYGSDALAGVVNIITRKPAARSEGFIQVDYSSHLQGDLSLGWQEKFRDKGRVLALAHLTNHSGRIDRNADGFTDMPVIQRAGGFVKWISDGPLQFSTSLRLLGEERWGGQLNWDRAWRGSDTIYGEFAQTKRLEWSARITPFEGFNVEGAWTMHLQESTYGIHDFNASQQNGFAHGWRSHTLGKHTLKVGATQRILIYADQSEANSNDKRWIPGVYVQDEWKINPKWSALCGLRGDAHGAHGLVWSPQVNMRYSNPAGWSWRLNSGTGFRYVNLFTEEHAALSGSREVFIEEELRPEESLAVQSDLNRIMNFGTKGVLNASLAAFYTRFTNRILPDYETNSNQIIYQNLNGIGHVRGASADLGLSGRSAFRINVGTTYVYSYDDLPGRIRSVQPLTPNWVHTSTIWFKFNRHWEWSWLIRHTGRMSLPAHPEGQSSRTEPFSIHHIQLRYACEGRWAAWIGVRNLLNYTQPNPIIHAHQPFDAAFDTSIIYGPVQGRHVVAGFSLNVSTGKSQ